MMRANAVTRVLMFLMPGCHIMGAAKIMIVQFAGILIRFYPIGAVESVAGSAAMTRYVSRLLATEDAAFLSDCMQVQIKRNS